MTPDYRKYAFIREFPSTLIADALLNGFLHTKPSNEPTRPSRLRIDTSGPVTYSRKQLNELLAQYEGCQIGIMVEDWRWDTRNFTSAVLTVNREVVLSFRLLSRQCTDSELDLIAMTRRLQACGGCGYRNTPFQHANDLHYAYDICPVCGTPVLYQV